MPYYSLPLDEHGEPSGPVQVNEHAYVGGRCVELHVPAGTPPDDVARIVRTLADHVPAAD